MADAPELLTHFTPLLNSRIFEVSLINQAQILFTSIACFWVANTTYKLVARQNADQPSSGLSHWHYML